MINLRIKRNPMKDSPPPTIYRFPKNQAIITKNKSLKGGKLKRRIRAETNNPKK